MRSCVRLLRLSTMTLFTTSSLAFSHSPLVPDCGGKFNLCGFIDGTYKTEVIPHRYTRVTRFSEGLAGVQIGGRYGFIDEHGQFVIEPKFDLVGDFFQGLAEVAIGDKVGVINRQGEQVLKPQFTRAIPFTKDVVAVLDTGRFGTPPDPDPAFLSRIALNIPNGTKFKLYSIRTGVLSEKSFIFRFFEDSGRGLIWAKTENHGLYGLLRADGSWQVEPSYSFASELSEGRARVGVPDESKLHDRPPRQLVGQVDQDGNLVIPLQSRRFGLFQNGFGLFSEEGGKKGFIDSSGNIIGGRLFDDASLPDLGNVAQVLIDGKWLGLDLQGRLVANPTDGKVKAECPSGLKLVRRSGLLQVVGANNTPTMPYLVNNDTWLRCDRPTRVAIGAAMSYFGIDGHLLVDPPVFDAATEFMKSHASVRQNGLWGVIDLGGKYTVEPQFDLVLPSGGGVTGDGTKIEPSFDASGIELFSVENEGRQYWINALGVEKPPPPPAKAIRDLYVRCKGGTKRAASNNNSGTTLWGIVDAEGNYIIKPDYRAIGCFKRGYAWAVIDEKHKWCLIDPNGIVVDASTCSAGRPDAEWPFLKDSIVDDTFENSVLESQIFLEFGSGKRETLPPIGVRTPIF